jgi:hypothetical protein
MFGSGNITKMGQGEAGILYTVLFILGTILLKAFSFEGEDYLVTAVVVRSSSGRRIFRGIR